MIRPDLTDLRFAAGGQRPHSGRQGVPAAMTGINLATQILVIEDELMIAWMVESLLEDIGFTSIALAATGEQALEVARGGAPGLIITDVNLGPGMDGIAAASAIQAHSAAPVILTTGYSLDEARSRSVGTIPGVTILRKPVQALELRNAIARVLAGSESSN